MILQRKKLAYQALVKALQIRKEAEAEMTDAICIYDFVERFNVEVRFENLPSMEGMYSKSPGPVIILNVERPPGRRFYNCAHEFGHHVFSHGSKIDEFIENRGKENVYQSEEYLVDCFSGFLLMPKIAIEYAFKIRNWNRGSPTPYQIYTLAGYFGVGYSTLIAHMHFSLGMLNQSLAHKLEKIPPKRIRGEIFNEINSPNLVVVDQHWKERTVDIQIEDLIIAPSGTLSEGNCVCQVHSDNEKEVFKSIKQGVGRFVNTRLKWATFVRVSRKNYMGLSKYRHFEDPEDG